MIERYSRKELREIWLDKNIGRLNADKQGEFLGSFNTDDTILVIYQDGNYELTNFELTNHYKINEIDIIEKYDPQKTITAVHYDGVLKAHFVKRFVIETSTLGKKFSFISHERGSKLILITSNQAPVLSFNYRTKTGEKKNRLEG